MKRKQVVRLLAGVLVGVMVLTNVGITEIAYAAEQPDELEIMVSEEDAGDGSVPDESVSDIDEEQEPAEDEQKEAVPAEQPDTEVQMSSTSDGEEVIMPAALEGDFEYELDGTGVKITKYTGEDAEVTIPETIEGHDVTKIGNYAFQNNTVITSVKIPDSVTEIGSYAFLSCSSLSSINLPQRLKTIGAMAFYACEKLDYIEIPKGLEVAACPFSECSSLKHVTFEEGITKIIDSLFYLCKALEYIEIPSTVEVIGSTAFEGCSSLRAVSIPKEVVEIQNSAFAHCIALETVNISDSVTKIGEYAFKDCRVLSDVTLSKNLVSLGQHAFQDCRQLNNVEIPKNLTTLSNAGTFDGCTSLKHVTFEEGITKIADNLFSQCGSLEEIEIPDSVKTIGDYAFSGCSSLTEVSLGNGITCIPMYAFAHCTALTSLVIPDSVNEIKSNAFTECDQSWELWIPDSVTKIDKDAFNSVKDFNLITVYGVPGSEAEKFAEKKGMNFVSVADIEAEELNFAQSEYTVNKGESLRLTVNVKGMPNWVSGSFKWESDDSGIVSVSKGTVTGIKGGETTVTVTSVNAKASCTVKVVEKVTSIRLDKKTLSMDADESKTDTLKATVQPDSATNKGIHWSSTDENVASVSEDGVVTAHSAGKCTIKVEAVDGSGVSASCGVTVTSTVVFDPQNGTDVVKVTGISGGGTVKLPATPVKSGFHFGGWFTQKDGSGVRFTAQTPVTKSVTVYAYWTNGDLEYEEFVVKAIPDQTYTGSQIKPEPVVTDGGKVLENGTDYTVSYKNNTKAGVGQVIVKGKGNYTKNMTVEFTISPKDLGDGDISASAADKIANTKVQESYPTVKWGKKTLKKGTDYTVEFNPNNPAGAGTVNVIVKGTGNYTGTCTTAYRIVDSKIDLNGEDIQLSVVEGQDLTYTGSAIKPEIKVTAKVADGSVELVSGKDYTVSYSNNTNAAQSDAAKAPTITVKGKGIYTGSRTQKFAIDPMPLEDNGVTVTVEETKSTGKNLTPSVTVKAEVGGKAVTLKKGKDYSLDFETNNSGIKHGTEAVTVTGTGNYIGTIKADWHIYETAASTFVAEADAATYDPLKDAEPEVRVYASKADKNPLESDKYQVTYQNNDKAGTGKAVITGLDEYGGSKTISFKINKRDLGGANCELDIAGGSVYTGSAVKPAVTVTDGSYTLKENIDYTVSYKNNKNAADESASKLPTVTVKGKGNYSGSLSGTFTTGRKSLNEGSGISIIVKDMLYNKKKAESSYGIVPSVSVKDGAKTLKSGTDYTILDCTGNDDITDDATVLIEGRGNYEGELEETFRIYEKDISSATVAKIENQLYTGDEICPTPEVWIKVNGKNMELDEDQYEYSYENNIKVGKGKVIITGCGEYGGTKTVTFTILPKWLKWSM